MKEKEKNLGIEIIMILCVVIVSILVLSKAFVMAKAKSDEAAILSDAVTLASNVADVYLSYEEAQDVCNILNEKDNAKLSDVLTASYDEDLSPATNGIFKAQIVTEKNGNFETAVISIFHEEVLIYEIETGKEVKR